MKKYLTTALIAIFLFGTYSYFQTEKPRKKKTVSYKSVSYGSNSIGGSKDRQGRKEWETQRLADPLTGEIPGSIRKKELEFARKYLNKTATNDKSSTWVARGPYNVGGRTRAFALDVRDENIMWAGAVSGGIWKSTDAGQNWKKITPSKQIQNVTTFVQDQREGEEDTWYYGTGEARGNSASGPGAFYLGNGIYKTTDNGDTWTSLSSTASNTPQTFDSQFDLVFRLAIDNNDTTNDVVYAATPGSILRSEDGGDNWATELGGSGGAADATDIAVTSKGIVYATLSSESTNNGIWRSENGLDWTNILPLGFPSVYNRIVLAISPSNENELYFLANTPGGGQASTNFLNTDEFNSLWKYTYISGNGSGSGGSWTDLSSSIPHGFTSTFDNFYSQGSYDLVVKIKPDDANTVIIGGTNLYRSTDGFATENNTTQIGGYELGTTLPDFQIYDNHHPDQHDVLFLPSNPDIMFSASDGGVHRTDDIYASVVDWTSLNNGYQSTQLYSVGFNPSTTDDILVGGFQDNGNFFTSSGDPKSKWVLPLNGDGAFMGIANAGNPYYLSIQNGRIFKMDLNKDGEVNGYKRIDPIGGSGYNFINPFVLDPNNNDLMYVAGGRRVWRNDSLSAIDLTDDYDQTSQGWFSYSETLASENVSAIAISTEPANVLYYGTNSSRLFKIENAHTGDPTPQEITKTRRDSRFDAFPSGGNINSIAIDPTDADKVLIAFSNYNVYSLYYTEDGGDTWGKVGGNLELSLTSNVANAAPSCRWVSILPYEDSTVYFVGTSVGLYSTDTLLFQDSDTLPNNATVWKQVEGDLIGNVVVEMVQTRTTDGLIAAATHGNGIYTVKTIEEDTVGLFENPHKNAIALKVYPNPSTGNFTISSEPSSSSEILIIRSVEGKEVYRETVNSNTTNSFTIQLNDVKPGLYYVTVGKNSTKILITR